MIDHRILDRSNITAHMAKGVSATLQGSYEARTRRDAATRRGRHCPRVRPRCATWIPCAFLQLALMRADAAPTRADSPGIGQIQAEIQKKKKRCRMHRLTYF